MKLKLALYGLLALLCWGCAAPNPNQPDKGNTQTQVTEINIGESPSPGSACLAVNKVVINSIPPFNHVGGSQVLGFTSFDSTGTARDRKCDQASTEAWSVASPGVLSTSAGVNPTLTATGSGTFPVGVCVDAVCDSTQATAN